ncbi:MAG: RNA-binding protein [Acetobacteraceae bacterium]|nr:RNA-binding protein [Acetobacteraceae bacterium]
MEAASQPPPEASLPDGDDDPPERGPLRRCVVTRESQAKESMIRFVVGPDRALVADLAGRLPGRGIWLSAQGDVFDRALKAGSFAKAARGPVQLAPDLKARIVGGLRSRIRDLIGFARRGGQAVAGREAVLEWLRAGRPVLLVEASDGSEAERARLLGGRPLEVLSPLTAEELGGVFGRDRAVHVAIAEGRMADALRQEAKRLAGFAPG